MDPSVLYLQQNGDIDDIEELGATVDAAGTEVRESYRHVPRRIRKTRKTDQIVPDAVQPKRQRASPSPSGKADSIPQPPPLSENFLPGTQSVYVKTWGCSHNNSDSEYMAGQLAAEGYRVLLDDASREDAQVWLLNSCAVKGPSEATFVNAVNEAVSRGKRVVVAGCVPQATSAKGSAWQDYSIVGVQQIDRVVEVVEESLKGNVVRLTRERKEGRKKLGGAALDLPKIRRNPYIEIIPINTGCLNQCTYCKTKQARGDLGSYPPEEIISRVVDVLQEGVMEIWLTSEDTGAYGRDLGTNIVVLLRGILSAMEELAMEKPETKDAMLRVGMTNPPYILEHLEDIAEIMNHPRVYAFLHVPVQAGSDKVLRDMKRLYTVADFERVARTLTERVPGITLATDIICGFPTETDEDFEQTLELLSRWTFPVTHISQFYPRPGTPAARMRRVQTHIVKARSRAVTDLFESQRDAALAASLGSVGERLSVIITDRSADGEHLVGHDRRYRQVIVREAAGLMGKRVDVQVTEVGRWSLKARAVGDGEQVAAVEGLEEEGFVRVGRKMVKMAGAHAPVLSLGKDNEFAQRALKVSAGSEKPSSSGGTSLLRIVLVWTVYLLVCALTLRVAVLYEHTEFVSLSRSLLGETIHQGAIDIRWSGRVAVWAATVLWAGFEACRRACAS
ncbi:CDK5 regulatory subunit associated protein 1-like 1 [Cladochytrium replicatum]|nr:CDK5 regulatory subunit associated protein 1-like 1 [Cladochytrium replicatum]